MMRRERALVITSSPLEYDAVRGHVEEPRELATDNWTRIESGGFGRGAGIKWDVTIAEGTRRGARTAQMTARLIEQQEPAIVIFVGVSRGIKDVRHGDVVAGSWVYAMQDGPDVPGGDDGQRPPHWLLQLAGDIVTGDGWCSRLDGDMWSALSAPRAFVGPIVWDARVAKSADGVSLKATWSDFGDALALETESFAFEETDGMRTLPALVVRSISRLIDDEDDDETWRPRAANSAAAYAFEVLALVEADSFGVQELDPAKGVPSGEPGLRWNLPPRPRTMVGRDELLARVVASLRPGGKAVLSQHHAMHGLGGVGKTVLATEVAHEIGSDFELVHWIRAEEEDVRATDFSDLALRLGLAPAGKTFDQERATKAVQRWLLEHDSWLLIFDNAQEWADVFDLVPRGAPGRVLVTSRNAGAWQSGDTVTFALDVWEPEASAAFIRQRTGSTDETDIQELATELGHLPLALEQACAYIRKTGRTVASYRDLLRRDLRRPLSKHAPRDHGPVASTWNISFEKVAEDRLARDVLWLCAFLGPEDIPRSLLEMPVASRCTSPEDAMSAVDDAIGLLREYSLVTARGDGLDMHRLVAEIIRASLDHEELARRCAQAHAAILDLWPDDSDDLEAWDQYGLLMPHAVALAEKAKQHRVESRQTAELRFRVALYHTRRGLFFEARESLEVSLSLLEGIHPSDHPELGLVRGVLGIIVHRLEDLDKARELQEQALSILEAGHDSDRPEVAWARVNLSNVLQQDGDLEGARVHLEHALEIQERVLGADDIEVARTLANLANVVVQQAGGLERAHDLIMRALAIKEASCGRDHPEVARTLGTVGFVLRLSGDIAGARRHQVRALTILRRFYGASPSVQHVEVAIATGNVGNMLAQIGELRDAHDLERDALRVKEEVYGPLHPDVASTVGNFGNVLMQMGFHDEAREQHERALTIFEDVYGSDHIEVGLASGNLGNTLAQLAELDSARGYQELALRLKATYYGEDHSETALTAGNLGNVLAQMGDIAAACEQLERALAIKQRIFGPVHLEVALALSNLGTARAEAGEPDAAVEHLQRAAAILEELDSELRPDLGRTLASLAAVHDARGDAAAAAACRDRIPSELGDESWRGPRSWPDYVYRPRYVGHFWGERQDRVIWADGPTLVRPTDVDSSIP